MVYPCINNTNKWLISLTKYCNTCSRSLFKINFGFTNQYHIKLKNKCKHCTRIYNKTKSKKYILERKNRFKTDDKYKVKILEYDKKYRKNINHIKYIKNYNSEYYQRNINDIKENNKKYYNLDYKKNSDKYKDNHYKYVKNDPENYRRIRLKYKHSNKGKLTQKILDNNRRELKLSINENYNIDDIKFTFELFDNKCFNCSSIDNLSVDHHKPLSKGFGLSRSNAVILCRSCNSKKGNKLPEQFYSAKKIILLDSILNITNN